MKPKSSAQKRHIEKPKKVTKPMEKVISLMVLHQVKTDKKLEELATLCLNRD